MAFIVYSNSILCWHIVSVCWRDTNILVLPRHQRLSIDLHIFKCIRVCMYVYVHLHICMYMYVYMYIYVYVL